MRVPALRSLSTLLVTFTAATVLPGSAHAQDGYLFKPPIATLSLRVGASGPSASGDLFKFFTQQLTIDRSDFRTMAFAADLAIHAAPRLDVVLGAAVDHSQNRSEFRDWVDNNDLPIEQTTELTRAPVTVSARYYLTDRGRTIGHHAWIPSRANAYVTAGGGIMYYNLTQDGDWVSYETLDVFTHRFQSDGVGPTAHIGFGGDIGIASRIALTAEGRYSFASAKLDPDFADFDSIDLNGFQITTGLSFRF